MLSRCLIRQFSSLPGSVLLVFNPIRDELYGLKSSNLLVASVFVLTLFFFVPVYVCLCTCVGGCTSLLSHARLRCMCTCNRCTFCHLQNFINSELVQTVKAKLYTAILSRSLLFQRPSNSSVSQSSFTLFLLFFFACHFILPPKRFVILLIMEDSVFLFFSLSLWEPCLCLHTLLFNNPPLHLSLFFFICCSSPLFWPCFGVWVFLSCGLSLTTVCIHVNLHDVSLLFFCLTQTFPDWVSWSSLFVIRHLFYHLVLFQPCSLCSSSLMNNAYVV